jgi:carbamoyltransferase
VKVLGISPLDKDASASLVEDGTILFASGEERYTRKKQHAGFPRHAILAALEATGTSVDELDEVAYPFLDWEEEGKHIQRAVSEERKFYAEVPRPDIATLLRVADARVPQRTEPVHGLASPNQKMVKPLHKRLAYRLYGLSAYSKKVSLRESAAWGQRATAAHKHWSEDLQRGLADLGLTDKLKRYDHHLSHASNAYLASGFDRALVVTLDGYGTGLAGSISLGEGGTISRKQRLLFPHSLGTFYETVTGSLGFTPDRHAGKIVGLAAYGDPAILGEAILAKFHQEGSNYRIFDNLNSYFSRHIATRFPMIDVAAAWQWVLEQVACKLVSYWADTLGCKNVVLSGGVTANVKMNQRIHEIEGVEGIYVYPNMGDGGCGSGIAMHASWKGGARDPLPSAYLGPEYSDDEIKSALDKAGLPHENPGNMAKAVAEKIHSGKVVARFAGRMEYGPRALGNRSILYHGREPEVNQWLNQRLGRTEFMPFAPVTLWEKRAENYLGLTGAEYTAQFMTITFDCTDHMKQSCPAAVHVDGTARPQLIKRELNPGYYDILTEYQKLSGLSSLINTSFNMHEEPIVRTPDDAIRAFLDGRLDCLAIGGFLVDAPEK